MPYGLVVCLFAFRLPISTFLNDGRTGERWEAGKEATAPENCPKIHNYQNNVKTPENVPLATRHTLLQCPSI